MRYLLQRARTNQWLTRDFELSDAQRTRALSGPGGISGFVEPEWRNRLAPDGQPMLAEWGTFIYAVEGNRIRCAGIVEKLNYEGGRLAIDAPGFVRYAAGEPYPLVNKFIHQDPFVVARHLWTVLQSRPNSNLGITVDPTVSPESLWIGTNADPYALAWWENTDMGGEFDNLARQTPFDYMERHAWTSDTQTAVAHHIQLGFPRLGRKRSDLRFAEGENIISSVPVAVDGAQYANELIGIGSGEGSQMIHATMGVDDGRLRRTRVVTDKTASKARLDALLRTVLTQLRDVADIEQVTIQDHINARLSAIEPGDDILIQATIPWLGAIRLWVRVLAITESDSDPDRAVLTTRRSDSFIYSSTLEVA
jgi:hypothetical protein